jgi:hypothetical protein
MSDIYANDEYRSQVGATNRPDYRADISKVTAHERFQQLYLDDCFGKRREERS